MQKYKHLRTLIKITLSSFLALFIFSFYLQQQPSNLSPSPEYVAALRPNRETSGRQNNVYVAALLYNSEDILPQFTESLIRLHTLLDKRGGSIYVSIFENGSKDGTKLMLAVLKKQLVALGIPHTIRAEPVDPDKKHIRRVLYLARLRNVVLEQLDTRHYSKVLWLNDVLWDPIDALKLIDASDKADAVCGMDFESIFYDTFASRESTQHPWPMHDWPPYFMDDSKRRQYLQGKDPLVRMFSCWNGMIAFKAEIFDKVKFRGVLPQDKKEMAFEASECCLIFVDMAKQGHDRVYMDTSVKVRYRERSWANYIVSIWIEIAGPLLYAPSKPKSYDTIYPPVIARARKYLVQESDMTCIQPFLPLED